MYQNICKFNPSSSSDLVCTCFVLERCDVAQEERICTEHTVYLVMSGLGRVALGGRWHPIETGDLFFACKGERIAIELGDMEYAYIRFHGRRAAEYFERLCIGDEQCIFPGQEVLIPLWRDSLTAATDGNLDLYSEAVLLFSLARLKPHKKKENDVISKIVRLTSERFSDPKLSLSAIAAEVGYHDKYVSSLFKKQKGVTYTQYLRDLRIKHAIFLMEQGVVSVKNVAILSGFGDALYFSKVFKESEGVAPSEMIKRLLGKE